MYNMLLMLVMMMMKIVLTPTFITLCLSDTCQAASDETGRSYEYQIINTIFYEYEPRVRPVADDADIVNVYISFWLRYLETNEKEQVAKSHLDLWMRWRNNYLKWDPVDFGNVTEIRVRADLLWTPDVVIANSAEDSMDYPLTNAIVRYNGLVWWGFPITVKTFCQLDVKRFPFDVQNCSIRFVPWSYNPQQIQLNIETKGDEDEHKPNIVIRDWYLTDLTAVQHTNIRSVLIVSMRLKRDSLFYIVSLIFPCFLIFTLSFVGFFLPLESGDKVKFLTSLMLALVVFLLTVRNLMPPTPKSIPLLGQFFALTMLMVAIALIMAVIVTNIYAKRSSQDRPSSRWIVAASGPCPPGTGMITQVCSAGSLQPGLLQPGKRAKSLSELDASKSTCPADCSKEWVLVAKFVDRICFWIYIVLLIGIFLLFLAQSL